MDTSSENEPVVYRVVYNDGNPDHLQALVGAKNVFANQLPKMPKEYIARLVLDRNHRTMVIQQGERIIGGICYRPFFSQRFAEIVFCAVQSTEQGKGFGKYVMSHLKEHVKTEGIDHFLTYADNYAIKYFAKQGFTQNLFMNGDRWKGWIKDYDGATLMECSIVREVNYLHMGKLLAAQRHAVCTRISEVSGTYLVRQGLARPVNSIAEIPGVRETGLRVDKYPPARNLTPSSVLQLGKLGSILNALAACKSSWAFRRPVDSKTVQDYYSIIKDPMDLQTMADKLNQLKYKTLADFATDLGLVVTNCRKYNGPLTSYTRQAEELWQYFRELSQLHFENEKVAETM